MNSYKPAKAVSAEELSSYELLEYPVVEEDGLEEEEEHLEWPTVDELEAIQKDAYDEGFKQGYKDGKVAGWAEGNTELETDLKNKISHLDSILKLLAEPLENLDEEVIEQLAEYVTIVARQIIRRELHSDPGQIVGVVKEALSSLPVGTRKARIHLHPEDAKLVRDALSLNEQTEEVWHVIDDPVMTRGGCRVDAENSKIDATVENRLTRVINTFLGGERNSDRDSET